MQAKLSKLNGPAFDSAYMAHMVAAHKEAVALLQREAKTGKDAEATPSPRALSPRFSSTSDGAGLSAKNKTHSEQ